MVLPSKDAFSESTLTPLPKSANLTAAVNGGRPLILVPVRGNWSVDTGPVVSGASARNAESVPSLDTTSNVPF